MPVDPLTPYAEIDVRMPGVYDGDLDSADPFAVRPMSQQMWNLFHPQPEVGETVIESSSSESRYEAGSVASGGGESFTRYAPTYGGVPLDLSPLPGAPVPSGAAEPAAVAAWLEEQQKTYGRSLIRTVQEGAENLRPGLGGKPQKRIGGVLAPLQALRDKLMPGVPDASDAIDWYKKHAAKDPNEGKLPELTEAQIGLPSEVRRTDGTLVGDNPAAVASGQGQIPTANDFAGVPATQQPQRPQGKYWTDSVGERVANIAQQMIGQPVRYGGRDWGGVDAPGLVALAYESAGVPRGQIPQLAPDIAEQGDRVKLKDLRPGDLVAVDRRSVAGRGVDHIAIYAGQGEVIEAPGRTDLPVRRRLLSDLSSEGKVTGVRLRRNPAEDVAVSLADAPETEQADTEAQRKRIEAARKRRREAARRRREAENRRRRRRSTSSSGSRRRSSGSSSGGSRYYGSTSRTSGNSSQKYSGIGATK